MAGYEGHVVLNYRLTRKLGSGGFGAVYLAEQLELGRRAACKILHPQFSREPAVVDRFFREARTICEIGHRAIVTIENFGRLPAGEPFYLMELAPGRSLRRIVEERWLTSEQLVAIFDPIADALAAAHAKQIVHRDLKPDNLMVHIEDERVGDVRLLDFGIAKLMDRDGANSITGTVMGTPAYMAPEQAIDAKHVDARADIYAFAATVYTAIARRPPFTDAAIAALLLKAQTQTAPSLAALRPGVPAALDAVVARCLAKDREHRPPTIGDAWSSIRAVLVQHALAVPNAAGDVTLTPGVVAITEPPNPPPPAEPVAAITEPPDPPPESAVPITEPPDPPPPAVAAMAVAWSPDALVAITLPPDTPSTPAVGVEAAGGKRAAKRVARRLDKRVIKRVPAKRPKLKRLVVANPAPKRDRRAPKRAAKRAPPAKAVSAPAPSPVAKQHVAEPSKSLRWLVIAVGLALAIGAFVLAR
jgi:eukaryotic-like serine/threonine-protein kinase